MSDIASRKDTIRRLVLAKRSRLDAEERAARAAALTDRLLALPEMEAARAVLAFASIWSEVPTERLLGAIIDRGRTLLLPWVSDDGVLRASAVDSIEELEPGYRGIPEPRAREPVPPADADVIIVPGVAFDPTGARLGYGGGFYDAFLRAARGVFRIGICFELQVVDSIPVEEHDELVDVVVTEERVILAARG
jgi:5-formyltetrahydrofolate cyclo-ligase